MVVLKALEFFSGIGGMHAALAAVAPDAQVACAFDINEVANDVYEANYGRRPFKGNIAAVSAASLDKLAADMWLLAPPCQPFTRQGLKKDIDDGRASCFMQLLQRMKQLKQPPLYLLLENVVGFESSAVHAALVETLSEQSYSVQEFILTPTQLGIPYSRPRYFCLAKKGCGFAAPKDGNSHIFTVPPSQLVAMSQAPPVQPIADFLVADPSHDNAVASKMTGPLTPPCLKGLTLDGVPTPELSGGRQPAPPHGTSAGSETAGSSCTAPAAVVAVGSSTVAESGEGGSAGLAADPWLPFWVPAKVLTQSADVIDIVSPSLHCCKCFTKNYTQFTKGTGSLVAHNWPSGVPPPQSLSSEAATVGPQGLGTLPAVERDKTALVAKWKQEGVKLRYFTPKEVANLHSFPEGFFFPASVTLRQRYQLLGNSLSVAVVADLIKYLVMEGPHQSP